ncbi:MAG: penicillin-binding protein 1A [Desulfobulbus sp.]
MSLSIKPASPADEPAPEDPFTGRVLDQRALCTLLLTIAGVVVLLIGAILSWFSSLPDFRTAADYQPQVATLLLDSTNRPIDAIANEFRILTPYADLPPLLPRAFVAAEDSRFWEHEGVDGWSIVRAAFNNLRSGRRAQGGSTITQQVTRSLLLNREKSYRRKLAEAVLSFRLERMLNKEEILYIYLNEIYLGEGAYGVEAAALTYFGKRARQLDLGEIALLAGLPQSPSNYSPFRQPEAARARQRYVLNRMAEDGIISPEAARAAYDQGLRTVGNWRQGINGYFSLYVRSQLQTAFSEDDLFRRGLFVSTTVDNRLQEAASRALQAGTVKVALRHPKNGQPQGALVALDAATGRIRAMVGGVDFRENQFNRAVQARRQPGSAFKPLVYAAALELGVPADSTWPDTPLSLPGAGGATPWSPRNFQDKYQGTLSLSEALICSSNVVAVRLLHQVGLARAMPRIRKLGIDSPMEPDLTLALGASPVSLLELTSAYTAFANQGVRHPPVAITRVVTADGRLCFWPRPEGEQVLSAQNAARMQRMLEEVVRRGTGRNAGGVPGAGGKTGTTDNDIDAWFVGSAGGLTTGVWLGHDRGLSLGEGETGGKAAAPVWKQFMTQTIR